jgi:hypothetical protein
MTVISISDHREKQRLARLARARGLPNWYTCERCGRLTETIYRTQLLLGDFARAKQEETWGPRLCEDCDIADQVAWNVANGWAGDA